MLFEYSEFSPNAHRMILAHSEYIGSRMQLECSSNSVGIFRMLSKCSECKSNAIRLQFECCPNNAHRKVPRMLYECRQNVRRMAAEYGSSVQECKQNAAGIPRMYLECTLNVTRMSRILPDYFLIGYKMLPNLAFSSVSTQPLYGDPGRCCFAPDSCPPARPAWKRCRGAYEKKEDQKTQKILDPSMAVRVEKKAVRTLRQTDWGARSRRPAVLL